MGVLRKAEDGKFEILLIKRKNEPYKDCWALPGGFMEMGETLEKCAIRELK
jgi:8-oxo-dGTP diphosphatase